MRTAREKAEMVRDQVISKIHWGAGEDEVVDWLDTEHGIHGETADQLVRDAFTARAKRIRVRAFWMSVLSGLGLLLCAAWYLMQYQSRIIVVGVRAFAFFGISCICAVTFARNLWKLLSGKDRGGVDF